MERILKSIKEILLIVGIFVLAWFIFTTVKSCQEPPNPGDIQWVTVTDTAVVIITDTLYLKDPSWQDAYHVASGTASTDSGDVAVLDIQYNPVTGQIGIGGHINYNPITNGSFTINLPNIEHKQMEEYGDVAILFEQTIKDGKALGVAYEPIEFEDGTIRAGLQVTTSIENEDWAAIGIRGAYRWRNVSLGAHTSYKIEFDEDESGFVVGANVGFYF